MTDQNLTPEAAAADAWDRAELALRIIWTRSRLSSLSKLAGIMRDSDRIDAARGIWFEYIDDRTAANPHAKRSPTEISEQASVLAEVARHLEENDVVAFAAMAWGSAEIEVHVAEGVHLGWTPWSRIVTITRVVAGGLLDTVEVYGETFAGVGAAAGSAARR